MTNYAFEKLTFISECRNRKHIYVDIKDELMENCFPIWSWNFTIAFHQFLPLSSCMVFIYWLANDAIGNSSKENPKTVGCYCTKSDHYYSSWSICGKQYQPLNTGTRTKTNSSIRWCFVVVGFLIQNDAPMYRYLVYSPSQCINFSTRSVQLRRPDELLC